MIATGLRAPNGRGPNDRQWTRSCMASVDHVHEPRRPESARSFVRLLVCEPASEREGERYCDWYERDREYDRSGEVHGVSVRLRGSGGVASPARLIVLLPGRSLREVLANGCSLLRVEHPCGVLVLGRPREVRAKERANELTTDVQLGRDLLRTYVLDSRHASVLSFARTLRAFACRQSVASIGRICAYASFGFCKGSIERTFAFGRALSVRATGRVLPDVTTPPSTPMREESRVGFLRGGEIATLDLSYSTK